MTVYCKGKVSNSIPRQTPQAEYFIMARLVERFIVVRLVDTEYWCHGTCYDLESAMRVAKQVHGEVLDMRDLLLAAHVE